MLTGMLIRNIHMNTHYSAVSYCIHTGPDTLAPEQHLSLMICSNWHCVVCSLQCCISHHFKPFSLQNKKLTSKQYFILQYILKLFLAFFFQLIVIFINCISDVVTQKYNFYTQIMQERNGCCVLFVCTGESPHICVCVYNPQMGEYIWLLQLIP